MAEPMLGTLLLIAPYLDMRWGGALLGYANRPGDILLDVRPWVAPAPSSRTRRTCA